jgi:ribosomal-protein-alanine N-acetyltransferase
MLRVRVARPDDWLAVETLNHASRRALPKLWWWEEYLTEDVFLVVEDGHGMVGALFAWPDDSPVAWVRLAILQDSIDADEWFDAALPRVIDSLRRRGATNLAWMDFWDWAAPHLKRRGFTPLTDVETLIKFDCDLPVAGYSEVRARPARAEDLLTIVAIDAAAFSAHWRYSRSTVRRRLATSPVFVVAELGHEVVGYAEGELRPPIAHLNRVAVHPAHQECGIGALLVRNVLRRFWRGGANQVTLNTQAYNHRARRLYRSLGFQPTGESVTAWELRF